MPDRKTKPAPTKRARKTGRSSPTTGSYFLSLELENVRCFSERQTLDLSDGDGRPARWTILLGENGTGKTTILQFLVGFDQMLGGESNRDLIARPPRYLFEPFSNIGTILRAPGYPKASSIARFVDQHRLDSSEACQVHMSMMTFMRLGATYSGFDGGKRGPLCFAYGAGRRVGSRAMDRSGLGDAAESLFSDDARLVNAEDWLLRLDYSTSKPSEIQ